MEQDYVTVTLCIDSCLSSFLMTDSTDSIQLQLSLLSISIGLCVLSFIPIYYFCQLSSAQHLASCVTLT